MIVHYAHQARHEFYNGVSYADASELRTDFTLGIQGLISMITTQSGFLMVHLQPFLIEEGS